MTRTHSWKHRKISIDRPNGWNKLCTTPNSIFMNHFCYIKCTTKRLICIKCLLCCVRSGFHRWSTKMERKNPFTQHPTWMVTEMCCATFVAKVSTSERIYFPFSVHFRPGDMRRANIFGDFIGKFFFSLGICNNISKNKMIASPGIYKTKIYCMSRYRCTKQCAQ